MALLDVLAPSNWDYISYFGSGIGDGWDGSKHTFHGEAAFSPAVAGWAAGFRPTKVHGTLITHQNGLAHPGGYGARLDGIPEITVLQDTGPGVSTDVGTSAAGTINFSVDMSVSDGDLQTLYVDVGYQIDHGYTYTAYDYVVADLTALSLEYTQSVYWTAYKGSQETNL